MSRAEAIYPPGWVSLREVGLRDGLQMSAGHPSTTAKTAWMEAAYRAGVRHAELGSFLPPRRFPQFADIRDVLADAPAGLHTSVLTMNERAIDDALAAGPGELACVVSASDAHARANIGRSREASVALVAEAVRRRDARRPGALVSAGIAMAFGCSISGPVAPADVVRLAEACLDAGADMVGIADTVGQAGPREVADMARALSDLCGTRPFVVHLHDTRGLGLANAAAALDAGARVLDGAIAGLGGCPAAPGATGNVVFEDLAYLCERMGFETGIDPAALLPIRDLIAREMPDQPLYGAFARAGAPGPVAASLRRIAS